MTDITYNNAPRHILSMLKKASKPTELIYEIEGDFKSPTHIISKIESLFQNESDVDGILLSMSALEIITDVECTDKIRGLQKVISVMIKEFDPDKFFKENKGMRVKLASMCNDYLQETFRQAVITSFKKIVFRMPYRCDINS